jgi:hypothetical protein
MVEAKKRRNLNLKKQEVFNKFLPNKKLLFVHKE